MINIRPEEDTFNLLAYGECIYCDNNPGSGIKICPVQEFIETEGKECNCCKECIRNCMNLMKDKSAGIPNVSNGIKDIR